MECSEIQNFRDLKAKGIWKFKKSGKFRNVDFEIMYVCMFVCMYPDMDECMNVCMYICSQICMNDVCVCDACMYVCKHVCIHA